MRNMQFHKIHELLRNDGRITQRFSYLNYSQFRTESNILNPEMGVIK